MFFILSKILDVLLAPLFWGFFAFIYCVLTNIKKRRRIVGFFAVAFLFLCSNRIVVNTVIRYWEVGVQTTPTEPYDVAIVLGGFTNTTKLPHDRVYFERGAGRITRPLSLYHQGLVKKILISGGSYPFGPYSKPESHTIKHYLLKNKVKENDIIVEDESLNTRQNALYCKSILAKYPKLKKKLLVTSAFHMRRAQKCFNKVGLYPDPFPVDYYSEANNFTFYSFLIPDAHALFKSTKLIHEIFGNIVYWIVGYN